jgi:glycosyltransferase involved in cell wall biosynthesis
VRLVFATQAVDADHPNLAATLDKIRALAERVDAVTVLTDHVGRHDLPPNVELAPYGGPSRLVRTARFEVALARALRPRPAALLAHMVPQYVLLAAPLALPLRVPVLLWYTHWATSRTLAAAARLSAAILSVDQASFPLQSARVHPIGHGIDLQRFSLRPRPASASALRLLALGRIQPWKGLDTLLRGLEVATEAGLEATLEIRGPTLTSAEERHRRELRAIVAASPSLRAAVTIADPVSRDRIPELLAAHDAVVSPVHGHTRGGALDKVVFEATGSGVPVLTSNPNLGEYLGGFGGALLFRADDPHDLARALMEFAQLSPEVREAIGRELRRRAEAGHSVEAWADAVLRVVSEVRGR